MNAKETDKGLMTADQLWSHIGAFASGRARDNSLCDEHPVELRERQAQHLRHLLDALDVQHKLIKADEPQISTK